MKTDTSSLNFTNSALRVRLRPIHHQVLLPIYRALTSPLRALPDILIIGAMKAGTTSLYEYLIQHTRVESARVKEVHYFDREFDRSERWYRSHFGLPGRINLEASPSYMFYPAVASRIRKILPNVKAIALLRNPVDRTWSHYHHNATRVKREHRPFEEAIHAALAAHAAEGMPHDYIEEDGRFYYIRRSLYAPQIKNWIDTFERENLLVLRAESMFRDPQSTVNTVCDFLEIETFDLVNASPKNVGTYSGTVPMRDELESFFAPYSARLYELLDTEEWWPRTSSAVSVD